MSSSENKAWKKIQRSWVQILYRPEIFSGLIFTAAQVVFITVKITFVFSVYYLNLWICKFRADYTISWIRHILWLVLTYDLSEDRCVDNITINTFCLCYHIKQIDSILPLVWTEIHHRRHQKCGENISDTLSCASSATILGQILHFNVICNLSLKRCSMIWNLFVKWLALKLTIDKTSAWFHFWAEKLVHWNNLTALRKSSDMTGFSFKLLNTKKNWPLQSERVQPKAQLGSREGSKGGGGVTPSWGLDRTVFLIKSKE